MSDVRVRFSPAPTGYLHLGSARTALFNWLYARHTGGTFVPPSKTPIPTAAATSTSTPSSRSSTVRHPGRRGVPAVGAVRALARRVADELLAAGRAYHCDCSQDAVKARHAAAGTAGGYDGYCRDRGVAPGEGVVVRFRTPDEGQTAWDDVIRGRVAFDNAVLEDFVIVRANGAPMFHLANAYDDLDMAISHVIRGEDLVNTTPRVLLLREAMGATDHPVYAHLPLIVNEKRQKLSKRRDDVSVGDYRDRGYLAEAMRNYLVTLGWGPKDGIEIRPIDEIVDLFDIVDINKGPAFFDVKKLDHFNGEYIRALDVDGFIERAAPFRSGSGAAVADDVFRRLAPMIQQRVRRLDQVDELVAWIGGDAPPPPERDWAKVMGADGVAEVLDAVIDRLATVAWDPATLEDVVLGVGTELGRKSQLPVRLAVTGASTGLPLFEPMAELDRETVLARLRAARSRI
ncbi:MAG: glutamate--tRNA ligase family protein [Acidimicrobiales bacterium]